MYVVHFVQVTNCTQKLNSETSASIKGCGAGELPLCGPNVNCKIAVAEF